MKERLEEDRLIKECEIDEIINEKLSKLDFGMKNFDLDDGNDEKKEPKPGKKIHEHPRFKHHERLQFDFDDEFETLLNVFDDEVTADAVIKILRESPAEIQIIARITIDLYKKIEDLYGE